MKLREAILQQFEPDLVPSLIEFGKLLPSIDADLLVFMARKSLCLYDVLLYLGLPPIEKTFVSDRVLDMWPDHPRKQSIALIDDTLIVGTTLAKTKRFLEKQGHEVTTHVLAADRKWWSRELIVPETVVVELESSQMMSLCSEEVRALSIVPRPYQVDFPIVQNLRVRDREAAEFLSSDEWRSYSVSSELQSSHAVTALSFFPATSVLSRLQSCVGSSIWECVEIVKLRSFSRRKGKLNWVKLVPMVTLRPMGRESVRDLCGHLVERIEKKSQSELAYLLELATSARAQQRLSQYILSVALGKQFLESLVVSVPSARKVSYDAEEAGRLFGPWLSEELSIVHKYAHSALCAEEPPDNVLRVAPARVSVELDRYASKTLEAGEQALTLGPKGEQTAQVVNLLAYFAGMFSHLFREREIPARNEALRLGARALEASIEEAPNRDRLDVGLTWSQIVQHACSKLGLEPRREVGNILSLALDAMTDLGVSVPTTSTRDGIVMRTYRHGEDALFTDSEVSLAGSAIEGLQGATSNRAIPKLVLEKLLVILVKIGIAKRFLEPLFGLNGFEGRVRIGFDLMGAIAMYSRGPRFSPDRDLWLRDLLKERGVIRRARRDLFTLGEIPGANHPSSDAPEQAYEVGSIIGTLLRSSKDLARQNAPLTTQKLIILASTWPPRHAAAALQAELEIVSRWFRGGGAAALRRLEWKRADDLRKAYRSLIASKAYQAVNQGKLKALGYVGGAHKAIVDECALYLQRHSGGDLLARKWRGYWLAVNGMHLQEEEKRFEHYVRESGAVLWEVAVLLITAEVALILGDARLTGLSQRLDRKLSRAFRKLDRFEVEMAAAGFQQSRRIQKLVSRLEAVGGVVLGGDANEEKQTDLFGVWEGHFREASAVDFVLGELEARIVPMDALAERVALDVEEYGKLSQRRDYNYLVWYDIVDSTATQANKAGRDVGDIRRKVDKFKRTVGSQLRSLSHAARKNNGEIYSWKGGIDSGDDEKHIFIKGELAWNHVGSVLTTLVKLAETCGVQLRVMAVDCGFVGTRAYRLGAAPEVEGTRFWEHFSRVRKIAVGEEEKILKAGNSFLVFVGEKLVNSFRAPESLAFVGMRTLDVRSEVEGLMRRSTLRAGGVKGRYRQAGRS